MALLSLNIHCRMRLCIYTASVCMRDHYSISVYDRRHSGAAQRMSLHRIELRVFYVYFMYCIQPPPLSLSYSYSVLCLSYGLEPEINWNGLRTGCGSLAKFGFAACFAWPSVDRSINHLTPGFQHNVSVPFTRCRCKST